MTPVERNRDCARFLA